MLTRVVRASDQQYRAVVVGCKGDVTQCGREWRELMSLPRLNIVTVPTRTS